MFVIYWGIIEATGFHSGYVNSYRNVSDDTLAELTVITGLIHPSECIWMVPGTLED